MALNEVQLNIAVIGGGVSGIVAAHELGKKHRVTLFEAEPYLGGHTNTILVEDGPDAGTAVDTGFIVCNSRNYPHFYTFLDELEVPRRNSDMCFGFHNRDSGFSYLGPTISHFLAEPRNLFQIDFLKMVWEQRHFNRNARMDLERDAIGDITLGNYLKKLNLSRFFIENYVVPLAGAIWSSPDARIEDFPATTFIRFFNNHGMLDFSKLPVWQTVVGGSFAYVKRFQEKFSGTLRLGAPVKRITRKDDGVEVETASFGTERFDKIFIATHADQALRLLSDPSPLEQSLLGSWSYHKNHTVLHTDTSVMPARRSMWASWNYQRSGKDALVNPVSITYYMNRLQGLRTSKDYFVTLNQTDRILKDKIIYETVYTHPEYTMQSVATQGRLREMNGVNNTFYCGSYFRYGFHEDGVMSAKEAVMVLLESV